MKKPKTLTTQIALLELILAAIRYTLAVAVVRTPNRRKKR